MKSIKWKMMIIYFVLVFIVMIISGTFIIMRTENTEINNRKNELKLAADRINEQVISKYSESDFQRQLEGQYIQSSLSSQLNAHIINRDGYTVASTSAKKDFYKDSDIILALSGQVSFSYGKQGQNENATKTEWMNYAMPVFENDTVKYVIFVRMNISSMRESLNKTTQTISIAVLLAMGLGGIIGYIFANTLTGPISQLTQTAKDLAGGNLEKRIEVSSNDEIGQLTENFNYMANELDKIMFAISSEKNKLETVLINMTDGILAYDSDGYLMHANPASREMLNIEDLPISIEALVENYKLFDDIQGFLEINKDEVVEKTIYVNEKYIKFGIVSYFSEENKADGFVVILQDITKQRKLDEMRKEFVANVSHELRTPLTTVKSYSETLLESIKDGSADNEMAVQWLSTIDAEADRMTLLITDLLQLSRMDNEQLELKKTNIMLNEFIFNCWKQQKILADKKKDSYEYHLSDTDILLNIDINRVGQVMTNIIGNAIKYSPEGASIIISAQVDDTYAKITVKDNGMGIPKDDLPRIFERFYRVDKARSRAEGGTGLGLAISKNIMELHGGMITAESEYNHGTSMTVCIRR